MSYKVLYDILCSVKRHMNARVIFRCLSNQESECLATVELTPHTYIHLRETLFCPSLVFAFHRHGHAES